MRHPFRSTCLFRLSSIVSVLAWIACGSGEEPTNARRASLVVYSGRSEVLVAPLIERFEAQSGIQVDVRYGGTAERAATILEEGDDSPADVYYGQDAGSLGALAKEGRFQQLPDAILERVEPGFRSPEGFWVGTSGRARVLLYGIERLNEADLPDTVMELTDPIWHGRVGWAPANGSFQAFITGMRVLNGDEATRDWLSAMLANEPRIYPTNNAILDAVLRGEIDVGLTNHYYLFQLLDHTDGDLPVANYSPRGGGAGALVNVAGAGILDTAPHPDQALTFIEFLLSDPAQSYFAETTFEYPLTGAVPSHRLLVPLDGLVQADIDLSDLNDLQGTIALLQEVGAL